MATDLEKLVVQLSADIKKYESALNRANGLTNQRAAQIENRFQKMNKNIDASFTNLGKAAVGFLTIQTAVNLLNSAVDRTKTALDAFGKVADASAASGLDAEFFQGLAYQASLAGVDMDNLSGSLETFAKNAGLAVVGKGKMIAALQKLNPLLLENIRNADSQEERVRLAADAIDKQSDAAGKAALATTLFGNSGTRLVSVFSGGADAIDKTAQKARELGIIVDRDLIASSDTLGDKVDTLSQVLNTNLNQAFVNLGPVLLATLQIFAQLAQGLNILIDRSREFANQTTQGLQLQQADIAKQRLDLENQILEAQGKQRDELNAMSDTAKNLGFDQTQNPALIGAINSKVEELKAQKAALDEADSKITGILGQRNEARGASDNTAGVSKPDLPPIPAPGGAKTTSDAERQAKAIKDLIDNLQFELTLVGKSDVEIAKANALRQAGATATDAQKNKIIELVEATAREKAAVDATAESIALAKDITSGALTDMRAALEDGQLTWKDLGTVAVNVLNKIADKLQSMLVDQLITKGFGGLFGLIGTAGVTGGGLAGGATAAPAIAKAKAPRLPDLGAAKAKASDVHVTVGLVKNGLNIEPEVVDVSRREAARTGKAGLDQFRRGQMRQDIERHLASRRVKGAI